MSFPVSRWSQFLLAAFVVSILLHSDALLRHFHHAPEKTGLYISGPRTDLGDNYYYFTMLRHVPERLSRGAVRHEDPDGGDHRNTNAVTNSYAAALYAGHALYRLAEFVTPTSREAVLLTSILHTTVLAFCFMAFLATLLDGNFRCGWFTLLALAYVGLVLVDAFGNSMYLGKHYWASNLLTYYSNTTRLINPPLFWAAGLAAAAFIVRWIRKERPADFIGAVALAGVTGLFSISVGATLVLALSFTIAFESLVSRTVRWHLLGIALATIVSLSYAYLQLRAYVSTPLGEDLRHGEFLAVTPKWHFLLLLGLIPFVWQTREKERGFVAALVVSAMIIGIFCESFHLGGRLWLRGAVVYVWAITVFLAARIVLGWFAWTNRPEYRTRWIWLKVAAMALMTIFIFKEQQPDTGAWKGFVERDKWELINWIDKHLPQNSVVASLDIEDAFLLPIYTLAKPLYSMYGLTIRTRDDELNRYFHNMRLFGREEQRLASILNLKQEDLLQYIEHVMGSISIPYLGDTADSVIFFELVLYHSHVRDLSKALTDPVQHQRLEKLLHDRAEEASKLKYSVDYAIIENVRSLPSSFSGWPVIYESRRYSVIRNPHPPGGGT